MQSEISDDVMKAARASTVAYFNSFGADAEADAVANKDRDHWGEVQSAAWAIMAERERCKSALSAAEPSVAVNALRDDRRMLVSHATMGRTDGEGQSVNDICVTITKLRNELYEEARKSALTAQVQDVAAYLYTSKSTNGSLVGFKPLEKTALRPDEWTCEPLFRGGVKETGNAD